MFYALARDLIPTHGLKFEHILQDIQTLNELATRGELDISAISIHAYAYVSDQYALLPSGASMGDGYGPMLVAAEKFSREEVIRRRIAVHGTMTSAFLALQLWCGRRSAELNHIVVPFDQIFAAVRNGNHQEGAPLPLWNSNREANSRMQAMRTQRAIAKSCDKKNPHRQKIHPMFPIT